jgi:hypothetical protein
VARLDAIAVGSTPTVGGPLGDSYFLSQAITPVVLLAGHSYMLSGLSTQTEGENGGNPAGVGVPFGSIVVDPSLSLNAYYYDYSSVLAYPTTPYGTAFFGPNFEFTPLAAGAADVPEPTSLIVWSLLGLTISGGSWWRRRKVTV